MQKILTITKWALMAISVALFVAFFMNVVPMSSMSDQIESGTTASFLNWAYILLGLCALAAIVFPVLDFVKSTASNPGSAIKTVVILVVIAAIFGISFALSSGDINSIAPTLVESDESTRLWSGAGLNALYFALGITVLSVLFTEIYARIKK